MLWNKLIGDAITPMRCLWITAECWVGTDHLKAIPQAINIKQDAYQGEVCQEKNLIRDQKYGALNP